MALLTQDERLDVAAKLDLISFDQKIDESRRARAARYSLYIRQMWARDERKVGRDAILTASTALN